MKVTLTKLARNDKPGGLRTDFVVGEVASLPVVGNRLLMITTPLDENAVARYIETSEVTEVTKEGPSVIFKTQNSTYQLDVVQ